jgi:hypothetical protein
MSVSRGLQVEEDDLIQFSDGHPVDGHPVDGQPVKKSSKPGLKSDELEELREGEDEEDVVTEKSQFVRYYVRKSL